MASALACQKSETVGEVQAREKRVRAQALEECKVLLLAARKADPRNSDAVLAAWDKAAEALENSRKLIAPGLHAEMAREVQIVRERIRTSIVVQTLLNDIKKARTSGGPADLLAVLKKMTANPGGQAIPPEITRQWAEEIKTIEMEMQFAEITKLLIDDKKQAASYALDPFIEKYPDHKKARILLDGLKKQLSKDQIRKQASTLFKAKNWPDALPLLKKINAIDRSDREVKEMIRQCEYEIELIEFHQAFKGADHLRTMTSADKLRRIWRERYERQVLPGLISPPTRQKLFAAALEASKNRRYREVRTLLKPLASDNPEAAAMIRQARYREYLIKGNAARQEGDQTTARALYKIAKNYAKTPAELKEINTLITATKAK